jgi:hypothetical protein
MVVLQLKSLRTGIISRLPVPPPLLYLFICGLFNDAVTQTVTYSVDWKSDSCIMNWKGCGRKRSCCHLRYYPYISLKELSKSTKNFGQYSRSTGWVLNTGPPEYEVRVMTTAFCSGFCLINLMGVFVCLLLTHFILLVTVYRNCLSVWKLRHDYKWRR